MTRNMIAPAALALLLLAACTPMRWEKPGATQAQANAAADECQSVANTDAWKDQWLNDWPPPWYDPSYMPPYYGAGPVPFWRDYPQTAELEEDMIRFCMHSKGYHLVAVRQ